jgi:hypothetical protein
MGDTVTTTVMVNSDREYTIHCTNVSDGTGESTVSKVDVSALGITKVALETIWYSTSGMAVNILWEATTDVPLWICPTDREGTQDFSRFGGLLNGAGTGVTGDVQFTTVGHTAADSYNIVMQFRKIA